MLSPNMEASKRAILGARKNLRSAIIPYSLLNPVVSSLVDVKASRILVLFHSELHNLPSFLPASRAVDPCLLLCYAISHR